MYEMTSPTPTYLCIEDVWGYLPPPLLTFASRMYKVTSPTPTYLCIWNVRGDLPPPYLPLHLGCTRWPLPPLLTFASRIWGDLPAPILTFAWRMYEVTSPPLTYLCIKDVRGDLPALTHQLEVRREVKLIRRLLIRTEVRLKRKRNNNN